MRYLRYLPVLVILLACLYSGGIYLFGQDDTKKPLKEASPPLKKEQTIAQDNKTTDGQKPITPLEPNQNNSSPETTINPEKSNSPEKPKVEDQPNNKPGTEGAPNLTETPGDNQAKANKILSTRLTKGDIARLKDLAKDGITAAEEKEALALLRARLPENEFAFLYNKIYVPYVKKRVSK